ncbi:MAG: hypothetical protein P1U58_06335 [Verrucomicrobiales bacterium]|nr:hypothetical protein [Verrucomicrobiales bacterium]
MKKLTLLCLLSVISLPPLLFASTSGESDNLGEPQISRGITLPTWENEEIHESFDIRIWPNEVILWLEQENLRDLIADPSTPVAERNELKRILAMQRAWRTS